MTVFLTIDRSKFETPKPITFGELVKAGGNNEFDIDLEASFAAKCEVS